MSQPVSPLRKIADLHLRKIDCFAAYSALWHPPPSRRRKRSRILTLVVLAIVAIGGAIWCLCYGWPLDAEVNLPLALFALGALFGVMTAGLVTPAGRLKTARRRWDNEQRLPQPFGVFEGKDGLLFTIGGAAVLYPWVRMTNVARLRRGRLWAAMTDTEDIIYIARDSFPTAEAFEAFISWVEECWTNRTRGHAFQVLPPKPAGGAGQPP